jgi:hypothetical protein
VCLVLWGIQNKIVGVVIIKWMGWFVMEWIDLAQDGEK